jgi:hypothetical protein
MKSIPGPGYDLKYQLIAYDHLPNIFLRKYLINNIPPMITIPPANNPRATVSTACESIS